MFPLQIKVTGYFKDMNTCEAVLPSGEVVEFDPFVSNAFDLTEETYEAGKGAEIVGKTFLISNFRVCPSSHGKCNFLIMPVNGGMTEEI